jgi:hypothetical protein
MQRRVNSGLLPAGSEEIQALSEIAVYEEVEKICDDDEEIVMNRAIARVLSASSGNTKKSIISVRGSIASNGRVAFAF